MRQYLVRYLRAIGVSTAAFGLAVCVPMAAAQTPAQKPEPRIGDAPASDASQTGASDADVLAAAEAALEADMAAAAAQFSNIRKVMEVLGPLPEHPGLFIPVSMEGEAPRSRAELYAVAPKFDRSASLFHQAELGSFASRTAAETRWRQLAETNKLASLVPAYADVGAEVRLSAGPLDSAAQVEALCVELSALGGPCRPVVPIRAW
jgi:hypothetical protein